MSVTLNHTVVWCRDKTVSARYVTDVLGPRCTPYNLGLRSWLSRWATASPLDYHDFYDPAGQILPQHYAFLVTEDNFDKILRPNPSWRTGLLA